MLDRMLDFIWKSTINPILEHVEQAKTADNEEIVNVVREIKILLSKFVTILEFFPHACVFSKDDLFSKDVTD